MIGESILAILILATVGILGLGENLSAGARQGLFTLGAGLSLGAAIVIAVRYPWRP